MIDTTWADADDCPRRLCRTPQECFRAGWDDAATLPPLTPKQIEYIARLLAPYWPLAVDQPVAANR